MSQVNRYVLSLVFLLFMVNSCKNGREPIRKNVRNVSKEQLVEINKALVKKDKLKIQGYMKRQHLLMTESKTGLWYYIEKEGKGKFAKPGKQASLKYKVSLLDGNECYSSEENGLKTFRIGKGGVESGLEEGILMLREGGKAKFIMPPHLAHGLTGDNICIPARAIIVYDVELISIK